MQLPARASCVEDRRSSVDDLLLYDTRWISVELLPVKLLRPRRSERSLRLLRDPDCDIPKYKVRGLGER